MAGADQWDAVLWDVGGVILDLESVREAQRRFVADLVAEQDLDVPVESALSTWQEAVAGYFKARDGTEFRAGREAYARGVEAVAGERLPREAWRPLLRAATAAARRPEPGAVETVRALADADLHLGVVSDVDHEEGLAILEGFGIRDAFDAVTTSEAVGRTKPDPAMFEAALAEAGVPPGRAMMVGDRYEHDVAGAADVGITAVAYGGADGPAADYRIADLRELLDVVGVERPE